VVNAAQFDSRNVSESLDKRSLLVVDDKRSSALNVSSISRLSSSSSDLLGIDNSNYISISVKFFQECSGALRLVDRVHDLVVNDQGDLGNLLDSVSSGEYQSGDGRSGNSRSQGVSLLGHVDLSVPSSPCSSGSKHSSSSAHVSESSLSSSVGTSSRDSRNTGNSSTSSP